MNATARLPFILVVAALACAETCTHVDRPATLTAAEFRREYLGKRPVVIPQLIPSVPSTDDLAYWSKEAMLLRLSPSASAASASSLTLGTNRSLSAQGQHDDVAASATTARAYLEGTAGAGYLFLKGDGAGGDVTASAGASSTANRELLGDAKLTVERWWESTHHAYFSERDSRGEVEWDAVVAIGGGNGPSGIPYHRHFSAWMVLLHGKKLWHLYPPETQPPGSDASGAGTDVGHAEWMANVLPTLSADARPLEITQLPGETVYVPEGWWHATANICGSSADGAARFNGRGRCTVVGIGRQARRPAEGGELELAQEVAALMAAGNVDAALDRVRNARASFSSPQLAQLHGDIVTEAISAYSSGGAGLGERIQGLCSEAAEAYAASVAAYNAQTQTMHAHGVSSAYFKLGRAASCAGQHDAAATAYARAAAADHDGSAGTRAEALAAGAMIDLNQGNMIDGVAKAAAAGERGAYILQQVWDQATQQGDIAMAKVVEDAVSAAARAAAARNRADGQARQHQPRSTRTEL